MTSDKQTKSWWSTLPGLLTAVGTAIAAVATLVATLHAIGMFGAKASAAHPDADQSPNPSLGTTGEPVRRLQSNPCTTSV